MNLILNIAGNIPFADESFLELAKSLGANERVVKQFCRWGEGRENRRRDVLLWAELVKRGTKQFLKVCADA